MARALSRDFRERVVGAVVGSGLSRNQAATRFGVAVSTANLWVRRFLATGRLSPRQIGGHKPATLQGPHRDWLLARCKGADFTLRGLVAELAAARGLKVDYVSVWRFVHAEGPGRTWPRSAAGHRSASVCQDVHGEFLLDAVLFADVIENMAAEDGFRSSVSASAPW